MKTEDQAVRVRYVGGPLDGMTVDLAPDWGRSEYASVATGRLVAHVYEYDRTEGGCRLFRYLAARNKGVVPGGP